MRAALLAARTTTIAAHTPVIAAHSAVIVGLARPPKYSRGSCDGTGGPRRTGPPVFGEDDKLSVRRPAGGVTTPPFSRWLMADYAALLRPTDSCCPTTVIASKAKQSTLPRTRRKNGLLRRVAPRNDGRLHPTQPRSASAPAAGSRDRRPIAHGAPWPPARIFPSPGRSRGCDPAARELRWRYRASAAKAL